LLRSVDLLVSMEEGREFRIAVAMGLVCDESVGLKHSSEALPGALRSVANFNQILEVPADLLLVPRQQDGSHVAEVLVQGGSPNPGLLGDL
jgi:hypothetical protein